MFTRRSFLAGSAAMLAARPMMAAAQPMGGVLKASVADMRLLPAEYPETRIWGIGGTMPGTEIRVKKGGSVQVTLDNELPQPTSIHWHGIKIDNAMDGVSGLTQAAVPTGQTFDYDFVTPDAGTYWYHAHNRSYEQVARGLYGALIVEEADPLDIDREEVLILDDWLLDPETGQINGDFESTHAKSHAGRIGNFIGTNGTADLTLPAQKNERLRLRIINAANARLFELRLEGLEGWTVALDGMPLDTPQAITDAIILGPAQRADLIVDVVADSGKTARLVRIDRREAFSQVTFDVNGQASLARRGPPAALPPNDHQIVDLASARRVSLFMEGGAMGGLKSATYNDEILSFRELVEAGQFWSFNGVVGGIDGAPLTQVARGESVRLSIYNNTSFPHAMHLHGMHFHEVMEDGSLGPLRDTSLIFGGEVRDVAFVADNPGNWLFHCHMLSHAASGMMTRVVVT